MQCFWACPSCGLAKASQAKSPTVVCNQGTITVERSQVCEPARGCLRAGSESVMQADPCDVETAISVTPLPRTPKPNRLQSASVSRRTRPQLHLCWACVVQRRPTRTRLVSHWPSPLAHAGGRRRGGHGEKRHSRSKKHRRITMLSATPRPLTAGYRGWTWTSATTWSLSVNGSEHWSFCVASIADIAKASKANEAHCPRTPSRGRPSRWGGFLVLRTHLRHPMPRHDAGPVWEDDSRPGPRYWRSTTERDTLRPTSIEDTGH